MRRKTLNTGKAVASNLTGGSRRPKKSLGPMTADERAALINLQQIPNVGPALAADLRLIGVSHPAQLVGRDPFVLYEELCRATGRRHDPCVIDQFIAAVRFMEGEVAKPWWAFTEERKRRMSEPTTDKGG